MVKYTLLNENIQAIIWDYDGTLVDTRLKNYNVTKKIISDIIGIDARRFSALKTLEDYVLANKRSSNWRELYKKEFNFADQQIDYFGKLWTPYQLEDNTLVPFFDGIPDVIRSLDKIPQGIVSQNSKSGIIQQLKDSNLMVYFKCIIGYEEVGLNKQKPEPDGLLKCIEKLVTNTSGVIAYIGDHETDMQCAFNANQILKSIIPNLEIITIGVFYDLNSEDLSWSIEPNFKARRPEDIVHLIHNI